MYEFRVLEGIHLLDLAECFNAAFSDYEQPIHFTEDSFKYYLTASAVDLSLSFGAFYEGQPVAFILNSGGIYNEEAVVFDAGTGVVPEHRGKKVFSGLFDYTAQQLQNRGIKKYYLEVLQANHHAIAIYSKKGFSILREYTVLATKGPRGACDPAVETVSYEEFTAFSTQFLVSPSFEHSPYTVNKNPQLYEVRYLKDRAYCIYARKNGAIIQLHYNDLQALRELVISLTEQYPAVFIKNIDCRCSDVIKMLEGIGFKEVTKQYEMVRNMDS